MAHGRIISNLGLKATLIPNGPFSISLPHYLKKLEPMAEKPAGISAAQMYLKPMQETEWKAMGALSKSYFSRAASLFKEAGELAKKAEDAGALSYRDAEHFIERVLNLEFQCYVKILENSLKSKVSRAKLSARQVGRAMELLKDSGQGDEALLFWSRVQESFAVIGLHKGIKRPRAEKAEIPLEKPKAA